MRLALCIVFVASFVFAAIPAFAQAGGEVADVNMKVTHITSSIGAKTPADRIDLTLRLRVVDEAGHEASGTARFVDDGEFHSVLSEERKSASNVKRWLKDGPERRLLLIELYISMFKQLDSAVADGRIASTDARIVPEKAQEYVPLAEIAAVAKCQQKFSSSSCIRSLLKKR